MTHGGLITGGPSWVRSERFEIQAVLPEGAPVYTLNQFLNGEAIRLEAMLRTLLAERFTLAVRRETKDVPVYALVVAKGGPKLLPAKPEEPVRFGTRRERDASGGTHSMCGSRRKMRTPATRRRHRLSQPFRNSSVCE